MAGERFTCLMRSLDLYMLTQGANCTWLTWVHFHSGANRRGVDDRIA